MQADHPTAYSMAWADSHVGFTVHANASLPSMLGHLVGFVLRRYQHRHAVHRGQRFLIVKSVHLHRRNAKFGNIPIRKSRAMEDSLIREIQSACRSHLGDLAGEHARASTGESSTVESMLFLMLHDLNLQSILVANCTHFVQPRSQALSHASWTSFPGRQAFRNQPRPSLAQLPRKKVPNSLEYSFVNFCEAPV